MIPLVYENWLYLVLPQKLIFQPIPLWQDLTLLFEIYLVLTTLLLCMGKAFAHFFETISPPPPPLSPPPRAEWGPICLFVSRPLYVLFLLILKLEGGKKELALV